MEKGISVKDIIENSRIEGVFMIADACEGKTKKGDPYWRLSLRDATGAIPATIWAPESKRHDRLPDGALAWVAARSSKYQEKLQLAIDEMRPLGEDESKKFDLSYFIPASPVPAAELLARIEALCKRELRHPPLRRFVKSVLNDNEIRPRLEKAPAAKSNHQAYCGGLLEHTLNVASLCLAFSDQYPRLDRQTLLAGAILHDIGKIKELEILPAPAYTQEGLLCGHIILGIEIVAPFLKKSGLEIALREHIRHLILSHHGQYEYGSPRLPQTAEAFALHYADNLDAKMGICMAQFDEAATGPQWSQRVFSLDRRVFLPERAPGAASSREDASQQSLLFKKRD